VSYRFRYSDGKEAEPDAESFGVEGPFWSVGGFQIAIVARVNAGRDWAAYVGSLCNYHGIPWTEEDTLAQVANNGAKLTEADARHFFPDMKEPYRGE
jgi:hypothetical protein